MFGLEPLDAHRVACLIAQQLKRSFAQLIEATCSMYVEARLKLACSLVRSSTGCLAHSHGDWVGFAQAQVTRALGCVGVGVVGWWFIICVWDRCVWP